MKRSEIYIKTRQAKSDLLIEQVALLVNEIKALAEDCIASQQRRTPSEMLKLINERLHDQIEDAITLASTTAREVESLDSKIRVVQQEERSGRRTRDDE